jgi:hypothetical protein
LLDSVKPLSTYPQCEQNGAFLSSRSTVMTTLGDPCSLHTDGPAAR